MNLLGVTGSRRGPTLAQLDVVRRYAAVEQLTPDRWLVHGDCVGADQAVAVLLRDLGWQLWSHPSTITDQRAWVASELTEAPAPPLERNHTMVDRLLAAGGDLLGLPGDNVEQLRSGTWATIRYAWEVGVRVVLIWPNGSAELAQKRPENHWRLHGTDVKEPPGG